MCELNEGSRNGDEDAFLELFRRYQNAVIGFLLSLRLRARDAEDVAQDTWLNAWNAHGLFDPQRDFKPWIFKIAYRAAVNFWRRNRKQPRSGIDPDHLDPVVLKQHRESNPDNLELQRLLQTCCLKILSPRELAALYFRFWEGFSNKEIAEIMELSEKSAEGALRDGKRKLKKHIKEQHPEFQDTLNWLEEDDA